MERLHLFKPTGSYYSAEELILIDSETLLMKDDFFVFRVQDQGLKKLAMPKRKKGQGKRKKTVPRDNDHLVGVLEDYSEMTAGKADR